MGSLEVACRRFALLSGITQDADNYVVCIHPSGVEGQRRGTLALVTDYDCWLDDPAQHVSVAAILERYAETLATAKALLDGLLRAQLPTPEPEIRGALANAMLTPDAALSAEQRAWLDVLRA